VKKFSHNLVMVLAILALVAAGPRGVGGNKNRGNHGHRQSRSVDGEYRAIVAGYYCGTGSATVDSQTVSLTINVHAQDGSPGALVAKDLQIDGPYFSGVGAIDSTTVMIHGRLDAARASRLIGNFTSSDGHSGHIVGTLPASADRGDDTWDDD